MNERELGLKWLKKFKDDHPDAFVYRISDSPVSRKPFDAVIVDPYLGAISIEFKLEGEKLLPHQQRELANFKKAGGAAWVVYFLKNGGEKMEKFVG